MRGLKKLSAKLSIMLIMVLLIPLAVPLTSLANVPVEIIRLLNKDQGDKQALAFNVSGKSSSSGIGYLPKAGGCKQQCMEQPMNRIFNTDDQLAGESGDMVVFLPLYTGENRMPMAIWGF